MLTNYENADSANQGAWPQATYMPWWTGGFDQEPAVHLDERCSTMRIRTELQRRADDIDRDLYRLICRVEDMYDGNKRSSVVRDGLGPALQKLRHARAEVRNLMHEDDRKTTG